jgi:hypothetical protein
MKYFSRFCIVILLWLYPTAPANAAPIPRTLFAFYDAKIDRAPRVSMVHRALEMPLNWLGFYMEYYERTAPFPKWRDDVAGVVLWLPAGLSFPDMDAYLAWLEEGMRQHKKILIMGNMGIESKWRESSQGLERLNKVFHYIGVHDTGQWLGTVYNSAITHKNKRMVEYERRYPEVLFPYTITQARKDAISHLQIKGSDESNTPLTSDIVVTHPNGGYVAEQYGFFVEDDPQNEEALLQRWFINPFAFLNAALQAEHLPRPDVTTLHGRRIFYSHLDGDGWNNLSEISNYTHTQTIAAKVLFEEIYKAYPRLPFTVAPIVAELDPRCYGRPESNDVAREIFALPNVEPATHTYSHPLLWRYFDEGEPAAEVKYLHKYPPRYNAKASLFDVFTMDEFAGIIPEKWADILTKYTPKTAPAAPLDNVVGDYFATPRSYACEPFNINKEITGSVEYINRLLPEGKKIGLLQWSGDTSPSAQTLRLTRKAGLLNINGGDSRLDTLYPSYSYVAPIGVVVEGERQIYSSNSNENTYTDLWSDKFFGFRYLLSTVRNTETPMRISPFNIYYHSYSAEKNASLNALKQNIGFAMTQPVIPLFTSDYTKIADGFYTTNITALGKDRWQIEGRGALQTIRFDHATTRGVDWRSSRGVIGQKHYQGSLYVFLQPSQKPAIIALKYLKKMAYPLHAPHPYLLSSRWKIHTWRAQRNTLEMEAQGFGKGIVHIYWPSSQKVYVKVRNANKVLHEQKVDVINDILKLSLRDAGYARMSVDIVTVADDKPL